MLDETLSGLLASIEGARVALLVSMDGMIVAGAGTDDAVPWDLVVASYADLVRRAGAANRESGMEPPEELVMIAPTGSLVLRAVTPEYGLLVALAPGSSLGRTRFELRKVAGLMRPELVTG